MKFLPLYAMFLLVFLGCNIQLHAQTKEQMRSQEGDKVFLIINQVKDASKADYENFMHDIFFPLVTTSKMEKMQEQYQKTRWLTPARPNKDSTWTYVFLMDPVVEGGNYQFEPLFEEKYSKEEAAKLIKQHESYMAAPPKFHALVQSKH